MTISADTRAALLDGEYLRYRRGEKKRMMQECFKHWDGIKGNSLLLRLKQSGVKWFQAEQEYLVPPGLRR